MALDSRNNRFSMLGLLNPGVVVAFPSGTIDAEERAIFVNLYSGIALATFTLINMRETLVTLQNTLPQVAVQNDMPETTVSGISTKISFIGD